MLLGMLLDSVVDVVVLLGSVDVLMLLGMLLCSGMDVLMSLGSVVGVAG